MTYLYRYYDTHGALLYVGIAERPEKRLMQHSLNAPWFPAAATVTVERYPDRDCAEAAETRAIRSEWPIWNLTGPWRLVARYLADQAPGSVLDRCDAGEMGAFAELVTRTRVREDLRRQIIAQEPVLDLLPTEIALLHAGRGAGK